MKRKASPGSPFSLLTELLAKDKIPPTNADVPMQIKSNTTNGAAVITCWCTPSQKATTAHRPSTDRLNPGRAFYQCGNIGRGSTCSFFQWVQEETKTKPCSQHEGEQKSKTNQHKYLRIVSTATADCCTEAAKCTNSVLEDKRTGDDEPPKSVQESTPTKVEQRPATTEQLLTVSNTQSEENSRPSAKSPPISIPFSRPTHQSPTTISKNPITPTQKSKKELIRERMRGIEEKERGIRDGSEQEEAYNFFFIGDQRQFVEECAAGFMASNHGETALHPLHV